jgi:hypothetical protein
MVVPPTHPPRCFLPLGKGAGRYGEGGYGANAEFPKMIYQHSLCW